MIVHDILIELEREYLPNTFYNNTNLLKTGLNFHDLIYDYIKAMLKKRNMTMPYDKSDFKTHYLDIKTNDSDIKTITGFILVYPKPKSANLLHYQIFLENARNDFRLVYGIEAGMTQSQINAMLRAFNITDTSYNPYTTEELDVLRRPALLKFTNNSRELLGGFDKDINIDTIMPVILEDYMDSVCKHYRVK